MSALSVDSSVDLRSINKPMIKWYLNPKAILITVICLVVLLFIDFLLAPSAERFGESDLLPVLPLPTKAIPPSSVGNNIIAQYSQFEKTDETETDPEQGAQENNVAEYPSAQEQLKQSGLLRQLYIDNRVYRLSGIVKSEKFANQYKAALSVTYLNTANSQTSMNTIDNNNIIVDVDTKAQKPYLTLSQGEQLSLYTVESVSDKRIVFNDNGRKLWLALFVQTETTEN